MRVVLIVIAVIAVLAVVGMRLWAKNPRQSGDVRDDADVVDPHRAAAEYPDPGTGSGHRHGQPVPGSQEDRERHGKP